MSVSYTYDTEGRSKTVSEDMPAGQQRFTEMAYSYLLNPKLSSYEITKLWLGDFSGDLGGGLFAFLIGGYEGLFGFIA